MSEKPDPKNHIDSPTSRGVRTHSSLKIYSGGLGILAGDYLKEASDKNVPMTAVGLLYRYGYFTQRLSARVRRRQPTRPELLQAPDHARARRCRRLGRHHRLPGRTLSARVWKCQVGRTDLYLLDADYEANLEEDRQITHYTLRRRLGKPPQAGDPARHRRYPRPAQDGHPQPGVPLQRGTRRIHRHRAHPRAGEPPQAHLLRGTGGHPLLVALHDAHPCTGRPRRLPRVDDPPVHVALSRRAGHHLGAVHQPRQDEPQRPERSSRCRCWPATSRRRSMAYRGSTGRYRRISWATCGPDTSRTSSTSAMSPTACISRRGSPPRSAASTPATSPTDSKATYTIFPHGRR